MAGITLTDFVSAVKEHLHASTAGYVMRRSHLREMRIVAVNRPADAIVFPYDVCCIITPRTER